MTFAEIRMGWLRENDAEDYLVMRNRSEEEVAVWAAEHPEHNFFFLGVCTDVDPEEPPPAEEIDKDALIAEAKGLLAQALLAQQFGWGDPCLPMTTESWDSRCEAFLRRNTSHDARQDDNGDGDICRDCDKSIIWIGPQAYDWVHA